VSGDLQNTRLGFAAGLEPNSKSLLGLGALELRVMRFFAGGVDLTVNAQK
jgi:hypothetical protein